MKKKSLVFISVIVMVFSITTTANAVKYIQAPPLKDVIHVPVGDVRSGAPILPLITWGGDIATIVANGNSIDTTGGSIFAQKGINFRLQRVDDFKKQVEMYMKGETPFLRCTLGMLNQSLPVLMRDPRTVPVVIYQMTWSTGGDCLVVKKGINSVKDFKGKTGALQAYGPHPDYLTTVLSSAGLTTKDVKIKWVKDLTGTDNTPLEAMYDSDVDFALMISPDGYVLSSNNTVGTGAEGSIKGARILMSTKTADKIIADVYVVRSDYFNANRQEIQKMTHGLLLAEQELRGLFKNKQNNLGAYKKMLQSSAKILLDSEKATADVEGLYGDCRYVGFRGNVDFFGNPKTVRNFTRLNSEIQKAYVDLGIIGAVTTVSHAKWDYDKLRAGLVGIDDVAAPRFKADVVQQVIAKKDALGTLNQGELFATEIYFRPNQKNFPADKYGKDFDKVINLVSTYGGALLLIEGHSNPSKYLKLEGSGSAPDVVLRRMKQVGKNLSMARALKVRDDFIAYAKSKGISLDVSQFSAIGAGYEKPKFSTWKTEEEWAQNMRVRFSIINMEAEEEAFEPFDK